MTMLKYIYMYIFFGGRKIQLKFIKEKLSIDLKTLQRNLTCRVALNSSTVTNQHVVSLEIIVNWSYIKLRFDASEIICIYVYAHVYVYLCGYVYMVIVSRIWDCHFN